MVAVQQESGSTESEGQSELLNEAKKTAMFSFKDRTIWETYEMLDGRFKHRVFRINV